MITITIPSPLSERIQQNAKEAGVSPERLVYGIVEAELESNIDGSDQLLREVLQTDDRVPVTDDEVERFRLEIEEKIEEAPNDPRPGVPVTPELFDSMKKRYLERQAAERAPT